MLAEAPWTSSTVSPANAIRRCPSSIRCAVASRPPSTSSISTDGRRAWALSTSTTGTPAARRRARSARGGASEKESSPSTRPIGERKAASRCSAVSTSKRISWYPAAARTGATPRRRSITEGRVKNGAITPIVRVRPVDSARAVALGS